MTVPSSPFGRHVRLEKFRRGSVFAVAQDPKQRLRAEPTASVQRAHAPAASRGRRHAPRADRLPRRRVFRLRLDVRVPSPRRIRRDMTTSNRSAALVAAVTSGAGTPSPPAKKSSRISSKSSSNAAWSVSANARPGPPSSMTRVHPLRGGA